MISIWKEMQVQNFFSELIHRVLDPSTGTETLFTLVALAALAVAAMAIYAMMMAVKILGGKR